MRKILWVALFTAAGFAGFHSVNREPIPRSARQVAAAFARALITNDSAALDICVQGEAEEDIPRIRSQLASLAKGPAERFLLTGTAGAAAAGVMMANLALFNERSQQVMRISASMVLTPDGWRIHRLRTETY